MRTQFDCAAFGIIGLETSLALSLRLVNEKVLSMSGLVEKMSLNSAKILKLDRGTLGKGSVADITIFDTQEEWVFSKEEVVSKSSNSPFLDWKLKGRATDVIVDGRLVLENGEFV